MAQFDLNAVVTQRIEVAPGLMVIRVVPDGWELPEFKAGQFAVLGMPPEAPRPTWAEPDEPTVKPGKMIRRAYSIASSSKARNYLEFYIALVRSGSLTPRLFALQPGDRVWLGPKLTGTFTLEEAPAERGLVLIATGTGLAPYMSMLRTELASSGHPRFAVLLGARSSLDLGYHAELVTMEQLCPHFTYLPTISKAEAEPVPWTGHTGWVNDLWDHPDFHRAWGAKPTAENASVFLCGNPAMIESMVARLRDEGFTEHTRKQPGSIFVERYW